jgi:hypothetical protein
MLRRTLLVSALGVWPAAAWAQAQQPAQQQSAPAAQQQPEPAAAPQTLQQAPITPQNALEYAFVSAFNNEGMRPIFRRYLMETHVALALVDSSPDAAPREMTTREGFRGGAIFTSEQRLQSVLGPDAPHIMINGRAALTRLVGKNVVLNPGLLPFLTLDPRDVAAYLATPGESSAGPSQ